MRAFGSAGHVPIVALCLAGLGVIQATTFVLGQELPREHVIVFNNNGRKVSDKAAIYPLFRLSERFGLIEDFYTPGNLDATLAENLGRSKMLYIGQYSDESPLFADADVQAAIRSHLTRGGLVVFDYCGGSSKGRFHAETEAFFKSILVALPGEFHPGYGASRFRLAGTHAILNQPAALAGKSTGHYGWFERPAASQIVLACDRDQEGHATLILQEGVLGKGSVLWSQLPSVFRDSSGVSLDLVKNVIAYAYGKGR